MTKIPSKGRVKREEKGEESMARSENSEKSTWKRERKSEEKKEERMATGRKRSW